MKSLREAESNFSISLKSPTFLFVPSPSPTPITLRWSPESLPCWASCLSSSVGHLSSRSLLTAVARHLSGYTHKLGGQPACVGVSATSVIVWPWISYSKLCSSVPQPHRVMLRSERKMGIRKRSEEGMVPCELSGGVCHSCDCLLVSLPSFLLFSVGGPWSCLPEERELGEDGTCFPLNTFPFFSFLNTERIKMGLEILLKNVPAFRISNSTHVCFPLSPWRDDCWTVKYWHGSWVMRAASTFCPNLAKPSSLHLSLLSCSAMPSPSSHAAIPAHLSFSRTSNSRSLLFPSPKTYLSLPVTSFPLMFNFFSS